MSERMSVLLNKKPCYDIVFTKGFGGLPEELAALECGTRKLCVVTDSKVDELYGEEVLRLLEGKCAKAVKYVFPQGEASKTLDLSLIHI